MMHDDETFGEQSAYAKANEAGAFVEATLIGMMMQGHGDPVTECTSHDFFEPLMSCAFHAINELREQSLPVTPEIVWSKCRHVDVLQNRDGVKLLNQCVSVSIGQFGKERGLATLVSQQGARREMFREINILRNEVYADEQPIGELIDRVERIAQDMRRCSTTAIETLDGVIGGIIDDLKNPPAVLSTGLPSVDKVMFGGFWSGKLYGIQGRMKFGKSLLASTVTWHALQQGARCLYVALEMGSKQITHRLIGQEYGMNALAFLNHEPFGEGHGVVKAARRFADRKYPLFFHFNPRLTFDRLKVVLSDYVRREGVNFIVVDYWQLVGGCDPRQSMVEHLNNVAQWLADFAAKTDTTIIVPAQENREGECFMGDGLRKACDMYLRIMKPQNDSGVPRRWLEMMDTRYTPAQDIGGEDHAPLWIDFKCGPSFRDDDS